MLTSLLPKIPLYWSFYRNGYPKMLPFSIVISMSYRCNSKCKTCDVWRKPNDDMTLDEWTKTFKNIGRGPIYMTFTGGEPFQRKDLPEMVIAAYTHCQPEYITIPTKRPAIAAAHTLKLTP
jgi:MoaA/NifB/PqqE/SkfB family radical SAM enzyme